jgi:hypothetical protein
MHAKWVSMAAAVLAVTMAQAAPSFAVSYTLDTEFSGTGAVLTGYPTVTFADSAVGQVTLTIQSTFTSTAEKIKEVFLNVDPAFTPTRLSFNYVSGDLATVSLKAANPLADAQFKADGDGYFDIQLRYATSTRNSFTGTDASVYTITCALCGTGFAAASFNFLSETGAGSGSYFAAAHILGIGPNADDSGFYGPVGVVPEPTSLVLLGSGFIALALFGHRKRIA